MNSFFTNKTKTKFNTLNDLRTYHDECFIRLAYRSILGRDPDAKGLKQFLANIRVNICHLDILTELRNSEEVKKRYLEISSEMDSTQFMPHIYGCVDYNKPLLIMDMYVLGQGIRTGVYRVCDEIFKRIANDNTINPLYYIDRSFPEENLKYLKDNGLVNNENSTSLRELLEKGEVFFLSPFGVAPEVFRNNQKIKNIHIIYDLIAIHHPEYFTSEGAIQVKAIMDSLDSETMVFSISEYTKNDLLKYRSDLASEQVTVFPLAADSKFKPVCDIDVIGNVLKKYNIPDSPYFLSVATVEIRKNFEGVIKSFYKFLKEYPNSNANLVITGGKGWKIEEVNSALSSNPQGKSRVIFTGYVVDEDLPRLYCGALAFIYLSRYEGFGLPPLEAMACGIPVISSDNSSLPEVVGNAGIMVDCDDLDAVASSMKKIFENNDFRHELIERSLARASCFNWEKSSQIFINRIKHEIRTNVELGSITWPKWRNKLFSKEKTTTLLAEGGLRCQGFLKNRSKGRVLISYVTVVRNNEVTLERTIESVQRQTYNNVEHIIIDGASTDGTLSIIERYADRIDYYASEADAGLYDALNKAVELCRGDLICILNSDDWLPENAAEIIASKYKGEKFELILGAAEVEINNEDVRIWNPDNISIRSYFSVANCCHNAIYATQGAYIKSGKYDVSYKIAADFKWIMSCFDLGVVFNNCNEVVVYYSLGGISSDSAGHIAESKRLIADKFPYLTGEEVNQLNYIFYSWRDVLDHDQYGTICVKEVFSILRSKYPDYLDLIGIINQCEGKAKKIAYLDHSYHRKTVSTKFLSDFLSENGHQVDYYWDESWQNGSPVRISDLLHYDAIIMFQSLCDLEGREFFSQIHPNITYIPMLDQFGIWKGPLLDTSSFWRMFQGCKVINFSNALHGLTIGMGIRSKCFRYYPKPVILDGASKSGLHGFLWVRCQEDISWQLVKRLIGDVKFDSFHIHLSPDPGTEEIIPPEEHDIERYNITFSKWFDDKNDFNVILNRANVFFAPRMEEGIGQSFLEAFSRGQCVVAPNNGTMNEYIQNGLTGLLYDGEDPQPLDFSDVHAISGRVYAANKSGYNEWLNSRKKIIEFILTSNKEAYKNRFSFNYKV